MKLLLTFVSAFIGLMLMSIQMTAQALQHYSLLSGGAGSSSGYCELNLENNSATIEIRVFEASIKSSLTIWKAINGEVVGKLAGGYTDSQGDIYLHGEMMIASGTNTLTFKVRDHLRSIDAIIDEADLNIELNQPRSNDAANSNVNLGECTFNLTQLRPTAEITMAQFQKNAFNNTNQSEYIFHSRDGSDYVIDLGGLDDHTATNMSAAWVYNIQVNQAANIEAVLNYEMFSSSDFENDEYSEMYVSVDGIYQQVRLERQVGNGNGGENMTTGVRQVRLGLGDLNPGQYELALGGFLNKKTSKSEWTHIRIYGIDLVEK